MPGLAGTSSRRQLRILLIGEGLVFAGAIEQALTRGYCLAGVFATSAAEAEVMKRAGLPVSGPEEIPSEFIAQPNFDVLLSIHNRQVLGAETLACARLC